MGTAEKATKEEIATEQRKMSLGFEGETDSALCCFLKSSSIIKKKKKTSLGFTDAEDFPLYSMKCKSSVEKKESEHKREEKTNISKKLFISKEDVSLISVSDENNKKVDPPSNKTDRIEKVLPLNSFGRNSNSINDRSEES